MNGITNKYNEIIDRVIKRSVRSVNDLNVNFNELTYYDQYNNVILRKKVYKTNRISYDLWENEYNGFGDIIMSSHTYVVDEKVYSNQCKTYYEYQYDKYNRIVQKTIFNEEHMAYEIIRNQYDNNNIIKSEKYKLTMSNGLFDNSSVDKDALNNPYKTYYYSYDNEGGLLEEKVCLSSGDISYYKVYDIDEIEARTHNPFMSGYAWTIDSISDGIFEISVKEEVFTEEILRNIVDNIISHYAYCRWILLDTSNIKNQAIENEKINDLMNLYGKQNNIIFNYI